MNEILNQSERNSHEPRDQMLELIMYSEPHSGLKVSYCSNGSHMCFLSITFKASHMRTRPTSTTQHSDLRPNSEQFVCTFHKVPAITEKHRAATAAAVTSTMEMSAQELFEYGQPFHG